VAPAAARCKSGSAAACSELLGQAGVDPGLDEILLELSGAVRLGGILSRIAGAVGALGHVTAADPHDRALSHIQPGAVGVECIVERVVVRRTDVVVTMPELGVAGIALLEVDGLRIFVVSDEADAASTHDAAQTRGQQEATLEAGQISASKPWARSRRVAGEADD